MKKLLLATLVFSALPLVADVFDTLCPRPKFLTRGTEAAPAVPEPQRDAAYRLTVRGGAPTITAGREGRRYAQTTFDVLQEAAGGEPVPGVTIVDWPTHKHRGLALDCTATNRTPQELRALIDEMALVKLNALRLRWPSATNENARATSLRFLHAIVHHAYRRGIRVTADSELTVRPGEFKVPPHAKFVLRAQTDAAMAAAEGTEAEAAVWTKEAIRARAEAMWNGREGR